MRGGPEPLTDAELNGLTTGKDGSIEGGAAESAAEEETEGEVEEVGEDLLEQTAHDVIAAVAGIDDKKVLRMLIKAEGAGKNRSSVLGALENRIAEL
jgi:uncharacterized protein with GYD domain